MVLYSTQLLSRQGPLRLIWIAAHLERQLKRQQVTGASIASSVELLLAADAPLALRLSGQLLLGLVRVFRKQLDYLQQDCEAVLLRVALTGTAADAETDAAAGSQQPEGTAADAAAAGRQRGSKRLLCSQQQQQEEQAAGSDGKQAAGAALLEGDEGLLGFEVDMADGFDDIDATAPAGWGLSQPGLTGQGSLSASLGGQTGAAALGAGSSQQRHGSGALGGIWGSQGAGSSLWGGGDDDLEAFDEFDDASLAFDLTEHEVAALRLTTVSGLGASHGGVVGVSGAAAAAAEAEAAEAEAAAASEDEQGAAAMDVEQQQDVAAVAAAAAAAEDDGDGDGEASQEVAGPALRKPGDQQEQQQEQHQQEQQQQQVSGGSNLTATTTQDTEVLSPATAAAAGGGDGGEEATGRRGAGEMAQPLEAADNGAGASTPIEQLQGQQQEEEQCGEPAAARPASRRQQLRLAAAAAVSEEGHALLLPFQDLRQQQQEGTAAAAAAAGGGGGGSSRRCRGGGDRHLAALLGCELQPLQLDDDTSRHKNPTELPGAGIRALLADRTPLLDMTRGRSSSATLFHTAAGGGGSSRRHHAISSHSPHTHDATGAAAGGAVSCGQQLGLLSNLMGFCTLPEAAAVLPVNGGRYSCSACFDAAAAGLLQQQLLPPGAGHLLPPGLLPLLMAGSTVGGMALAAAASAAAAPAIEVGDADGDTAAAAAAAGGGQSRKPGVPGGLLGYMEARAAAAGPGVPVCPKLAAFLMAGSRQLLAAAAGSSGSGGGSGCTAAAAKGPARARGHVKKAAATAAAAAAAAAAVSGGLDGPAHATPAGDDQQQEAEEQASEQLLPTQQLWPAASGSVQQQDGAAAAGAAGRGTSCCSLQEDDQPGDVWQQEHQLQLIGSAADGHCGQGWEDSAAADGGGLESQAAQKRSDALAGFTSNTRKVLQQLRQLVREPPPAASGDGEQQQQQPVAQVGSKRKQPAPAAGASEQVATVDAGRGGSRVRFSALLQSTTKQAAGGGQPLVAPRASTAGAGAGPGGSSRRPAGPGRLQASRAFYEMLVLQNRGYVGLQQAEPFGELVILPRAKLLQD